MEWLWYLIPIVLVISSTVGYLVGVTHTERNIHDAYEQQMLGFETRITSLTKELNASKKSAKDGLTNV